MNKLRKHVQIWFYLDCARWDLNVLVIDRYLTCWQAPPIADIYFSLAFPDPRKTDLQALSMPSAPTL